MADNVPAKMSLTEFYANAAARSPPAPACFANSLNVGKGATYPTSGASRSGSSVIVTIELQPI